MIAAKQYRIEFLSITAFGYEKCSSQWFNTKEEALNSKWNNEKDAVVIEREKPQHQSFKYWKAAKKCKDCGKNDCQCGFGE